MDKVYSGLSGNQGLRRSTHVETALIFGLCFAGVSLICFLRNPDAVFFPILFAEDGTSYIGNLYSEGFWHTLLNARPDYFVFGNVVLAKIAILINSLLYKDNILHLPQILVILAYLCYGLIAALPMLIFRGKIPTIYLLLLVAIAAFLPLNGFEFEILGRAANIGFSFLYVSFLLICWRSFCVDRVVPVIAIDFFLYFSASTNPLVYTFIPLIYLPYVQALIQQRSPWKKILLTPSLISAVCLSVITIMQGIYCALRPHTFDSHLTQTEPIKHIVSRTLETLLGRSILYPAIFPIYRYLNDVFIIALFICLVVFLVRYARKENYPLYFYSCYCLVVSSVLVLASRPFLLRLARHYKSTFPDRYYLGQNLLAAFLIVVLLSDAAQQISTRITRRILLSYSAILLIVAATGMWIYHDYNPLRACKPFEQTLQDAWQTHLRPQSPATETPPSAQASSDQPASEPRLVVETCPAGWAMQLPRSRVQASVSAIAGSTLTPTPKSGDF
jgi:hypothetical protein